MLGAVAGGGVSSEGVLGPLIRKAAIKATMSTTSTPMIAFLAIVATLLETWRIPHGHRDQRGEGDV